jgi:L-asparagine transporter-like permease
MIGLSTLLRAADPVTVRDVPGCPLRSVATGVMNRFERRVFPYLSWATLALLGGFVALMLSDGEARGQLASTAVLCLVLAAIYVIRERVRARRP